METIEKANKDKAKLTRKVITNKLGHKQTVWVKTGADEHLKVGTKEDWKDTTEKHQNFMYPRWGKKDTKGEADSGEMERTEKHKELIQVLGDATEKKLKNNTSLKKIGNDIAVKLYDTNVATFKNDGGVKLSSGGYMTKTTKDRINSYIDGSVYSQKGDWYVDHKGKTYHWQEGITLYPNGKVVGGSELEKAEYDSLNELNNSFDDLIHKAVYVNNAENRKKGRVGKQYGGEKTSSKQKKTKKPEKEKKYWMGHVPDTDDFKSKITDTFIDGKTVFGSWANMTPQSYSQYGVGRLGIGYGQKYKKQSDGKWLKVEKGINKASGDLIHKGGVGSRGGKVVGYTKGGNPIYAGTRQAIRHHHKRMDYHKDKIEGVEGKIKDLKDQLAKQIKEHKTTIRDSKKRREHHSKESRNAIDKERYGGNRWGG